MNGTDPRAALKRKRQVYWKERNGFVDTPCYDGDKLHHGTVIAGPAIIEEKKTTVVIPPGCEATVDAYDNYLVNHEGLNDEKEVMKMNERKSIDPLTLAVVEARINALNLELGARMFRQAFSVPTAHIRDLGTVLFDKDERTLAIGNFMPVHTGGSEISLKGMLDWIGRENIYPDDFIIANDTFIVRFGHLADWSFLRPIFYEGELIFYHFARTHQYDSGGAFPGCYFPAQL